MTITGPDGYSAIFPPKGSANASLGNFLVKLDKQLLPVHITPVARKMIEMWSSALPFPSNMIFRLLLKPRLTNFVLKLLGEKGKILHTLVHNNANVIKIEGGQTDTLQIPNKIEVHLKPIILPGYGLEDIIAELKRHIPSASDFEVLRFDSVPEVPDMALYDMLAQILKEEDPAGIPMPMILPTSTDGKNFCRLGIQTYGFLPMNLPQGFNFTEYIHAHNEKIPMESLEFGTKAIYKVLERYGKAS